MPTDEPVLSVLAKVAERFSSTACALRSSYLNEDSSDHSFAGIFESRLAIAVEAETIALSLRDIWASLTGPLAVDYIKRRGLSLESWYMPIIVQRWVDAKVSGVMFTADPSSGNPTIIMELAYGPCSQIVDGINCDERARFADLGSLNSALLSSPEIGALANMVTTLTKTINRNLDIEFSFDMKGELTIHQARAITTG